MTNELEIMEQALEEPQSERVKLYSSKAEYYPTIRRGVLANGWKDVDKYDINSLKDYTEAVKMSRFYYMHDPIASTVINKLIDIGITDIEFFNNGLSDNELRLFQGLAPAIRDFLEECALEYLTTGLVIPEIVYTPVDKSLLEDYGVKKMSSAVLPTDMWIRDSAAIKINRPMISGKASYYVQVPSDFVFFIQNEGMYPDGNKDVALYRYLVQTYALFVLAVRNGKPAIDGNFYVLLDNPLAIESKRVSSSLYPIPYTYPVLESLKHKRNMRRMDYSITSRVISAVQLVKAGNDTFPVTEDDESQLDAIRNQMYWRYSSEENIERVFQLFTNHTIEIEWVFPNVEALLDDTRYKDINQDILFGFGFPRILLTGESERSGTSDPEYAMISPVKSMEAMRRKLEIIIDKIINDISRLNGLKAKPTYSLTPMNIHDFLKFFESLQALYESGNLSREEFAAALGYDIETELARRKSENDKIKELGLEEFAPMPHSNSPTGGGQNQPNPQNNRQNNGE